MTENNKKQYEAHLELAKKLANRELTEEEIEQVKAKYDNPIATSIDLRPGETDLTQLKQSEINQMLIRALMDSNAYLKFINETLNNMLLAFLSFYKDDKNIDSFKALEEFKEKKYKEFKGE